MCKKTQIIVIAVIENEHIRLLKHFLKDPGIHIGLLFAVSSDNSLKVNVDNSVRNVFSLNYSLN